MKPGQSIFYKWTAANLDGTPSNRPHRNRPARPRHPARRPAADRHRLPQGPPALGPGQPHRPDRRHFRLVFQEPRPRPDHDPAGDRRLLHAGSTRRARQRVLDPAFRAQCRRTESDELQPKTSSHSLPAPQFRANLLSSLVVGTPTDFVSETRMIARAILSMSLVVTLAACASSRPAPIVTGGTPTGPVVTRPPITPGPVTPATPATPAAPIPDFTLTPVPFDSVPGWATADMAPALQAFKRQCDSWRLRTPDAPLTGGRYGGRVSDWFNACNAALTDPARTGTLVLRNLFRSAIRASVPARRSSPPISSPSSRPAANGRRTFTEPLLKRPPDMITVDLGAFAEAYDNETLRGAPRSLNGKHQWRPHRALSEARSDHALSRPDHRLRPPGRRLQPAGPGLRPPPLLRRHAGPRAVLGAERLQVEFRPRRAAQFRPPAEPDLDQLPRLARHQSRPNRSPPSTPIRPTSSSRKRRSPTTPPAPRAQPTCRSRRWARSPSTPPIIPTAPSCSSMATYGGAPFQRLFVAQDTGGAIRRGPNRGDVFAGTGPEAGAYAERMNAASPRWYTLLPKSFSAPIASNPQPSPG